MKKLYLKLLTSVVMLMMVWSVSAQRTISGVVDDASAGELLIGANIVVTGTTTGTVSDIDGSYSLEVPANAESLTVSYTGFQTQVIPLGLSDIINVTMVEGELLDEVVVIGYGTVKKDDATGAVNAVTSDDFNKGAIISPDQLITGKVAGVQVLSNSGEPGGGTSVRIRGGTSINASNEPLYVIDGVPIDNASINPGGFQGGRNPLNFLDASDIETFTVLKDASATAIYGSRGANGVILITTKRGKAGDQPTVSYNSWLSIARASNKLQILDGQEFKSFVTFNASENLDFIGEANTDWRDEIFRTGVGHNHSLSLIGGTDHGGYRATVGYLNQKGIVETSETERVNFSLNYNHKIFDDQLKLNFNLKGASTNDRINPNGAIGGAYAYNPTFPVLDETNSDLGGYYEYGLGVENAGTNPVSELFQTQDYNQGFRGLGNIEAEYALPFIEGLSAKVNLGFDVNTGQRDRFLPTTLRSQAVNGDMAGEVRLERYTRKSSLLEGYLTYTRPLENISSELTILGGYSYQNFNNNFPAYRAIGLPNDFFGADNPRGAEQSELFNSVIENRLISFFGRVNYSFDNRFLLTGTLRRDGSTKFGPLNRWGLFPSAALAWKISNESFMANANTLTSLKLRLGWGITGNQDIADYQYLARYAPGDALTQVQFGDDFLTTIRPTAFDPNLKWEETETTNLGLDFEFLSGRFGGSIDLYKKTTDDLLFTVTVPAGTNLSNRVLTNIGSLENKGVELALNGYVVNSKSFKWDVGFNVAYNKNEITKISGEGSSIRFGDPGGGTGNTIQVLQEGQAANSFFVYEHIMDENGVPRRDNFDFNEDGDKNDLDIYKDQNGDGIINESDLVVTENASPDFIYGLTSNINYLNFDLSFTLRANQGNYNYNSVLANNSAISNVTNTSSPPTNVLAEALVTNFTNRQTFSDYYVEDASFIRMDNITLGYNFPKIGNKLGLRLYVTGQNLFVLTDYKGLDPEIGNRASSGIPELGIDRDIYPRSRTFIFGLNANF